MISFKATLFYPRTFVVLFITLTILTPKLVDSQFSSNPALDLLLQQYENSIRLAINNKNLEKLQESLQDLSEELDGDLILALIQQISNPLLRAARSTNKEFGLKAGEVLLKHGLNPQSALNMVSERNMPDWIHLLVKHGASVSKDSGGGITPLMLACMNANEEAVQVLLQLGADISIQNLSQGRSAIFYAAFGGSYKITETLLKLGADPSEEDKHGYVPLCDAVNQNHTRIVRLLVQWGANVNPRGLEHNPIHRAIQKKRFHIVKILIKAGANLDFVIEGKQLSKQIEENFDELKGKELLIDYYKLKSQNLQQELQVVDEKYQYMSLWLQILVVSLVLAIIVGAVVSQMGSNLQSDVVLHITSFQFQN